MALKLRLIKAIRTCGLVGPVIKVGGLTAILCSILVTHLFSSRGTL